MTKAERERLLNDDWTVPPPKNTKEMIKRLKKITKYGVFDYKDNNKN